MSVIKMLSMFICQKGIVDELYSSQYIPWICLQCITIASLCLLQIFRNKESLKHKLTNLCHVK